MFLVYRKDLKPRGNHSVLLYGYGGSGISLMSVAQTPQIRKAAII